MSESTAGVLTDPSLSLYTPARCHECRVVFGSIDACEQHARAVGHAHMPAYFCMRAGCPATFNNIKTRRVHLRKSRHDRPSEEVPEGGGAWQWGRAGVSASAGAAAVAAQPEPDSDAVRCLRCSA